MIRYGIQLIIGLFFLFSGMSKLFPVEPFELLLYGQGISWHLAGLLARIIIIVEVFLGLLLLFKPALDFVNRARHAILVFLFGASFYLLWGIFSGRSETDCGCFGTWASMSYSWALVRNVVIILLVLWVHLWKGTTQIVKTTYTWVVGLGVFGIMTIILIINPPDQWMPYQKPEIENMGGFPFELLPAHLIIEMDSMPLHDSGKQIIAFMTSGCAHCKKAATKLRVYQEKTNGEVPVSVVFMGQPHNLMKFWADANAPAFPHNFLEPATFLQVSGPGLPAIFILDGKRVVAKHHYRDFNPDDYLGLSLN
jgi:hypothetical protein